MTDARPEIVDGRRRRGRDNRDRIVAAMMALVRAGEVRPSAEQVAARADVGLRTVFRHFEDMDALYSEISRAMEAEVRALVDRPFEAADWRGRLIEEVERRARMFEAIRPFRRAAVAVQHRSKFLKPDYARAVAELRERLTRILPPAFRDDPARLEALDLVMSFEAWDRLRDAQALSPDRAKAVIEAAVASILDAAQASSSMSQ